MHSLRNRSLLLAILAILAVFATACGVRQDATGVWQCVPSGEKVDKWEPYQPTATPATP